MKHKSRRDVVGLLFAPSSSSTLLQVCSHCRKKLVHAKRLYSTATSPTQQQNDFPQDFLMKSIRENFTKKTANNETNKQKALLHFKALDSARTSIKKLEQHLNIDTLEKWYGFTGQQLLTATESLPKQDRAILRSYYNRTGKNIVRLLFDIYPDYNWNSAKFKKIPKNFYNDLTVQKKLLACIEKHLNITTPEEWYAFSYSDALSASKALNIEKTFVNISKYYYQCSMPDMLKAIYPHVQWDRMQFKRIPKSTLASKDVQRNLVEAIGKELGIRSLQDWYAIKVPAVAKVAKQLGIFSPFNSFLRFYYQSSLTKCLKTIYPDFNWDSSKFASMRAGHHSTLTYHRQIFELVEKELGITSPEQWYQKTNAAFLEAADRIGLKDKARTIMSNYYKNSLIGALKTIFPEYNLSTALTRKLPQGSAKDINLVHAIMKIAEQRLHIHKPEDWYRVALRQIQQFSKIHLIRKNGGLLHLLQTAYPTIQWNRRELSRKASKKSQQRWLRVIVENLLRHQRQQPSSSISDKVDDQLKQPLPERKEEQLGNHGFIDDEVEVIEEYQSTDIRFKESQDPIELDIFVPKYNLAFEYNGEHHYGSVALFGNYREHELKDKEKRRLCKQHGVTLITVPYTWDSTPASIAATISKLRPDIPLNLATLAAPDLVLKATIIEQPSED